METTKVPPKRRQRRSPELIILEKAYELLRDPRRWTFGTLARNKYGHRVPAHSEEATRWCALGAIAKADSTTRSSTPTSLGVAVGCLTEEIGAIPTANDMRGYDVVMGGFKRAIKKLQAKEKK